MKNLKNLNVALKAATQLFEKLKIDSQTVELLKRKDTVVENLERNINEKQLNFSVIGTMKSGKSTFINALLGKDLMPNETEACTLVPTKVEIGKYNRKIIKYRVDGKSETLKGADVAEQLHKDIKYQRGLLEQGKPIDVKFYQTVHPLTIPIVETDMKIFIVDTPGPNEMRLFDPSAFNLEETFLQSLYDTSYLFFIIDMQYFKDEENVKLIEAIKLYRPELIEQMTFVINKIDRLSTAKDVTLDGTVEDVTKTLTSWGIAEPHVVPISSKEALYSKLISQSLNPSLLEKFKSKVFKKNTALDFISEDLKAMLPMKNIEIDGELFYKPAKPEEVYEELYEKSNLKMIEEFIALTLIPIGNELNESIATAQYERESKWLEELIQQHTVNIEDEIQNLRSDPSFKQVAGFTEIINILDTFQVNPTDFNNKISDYDKIYNYLKDKSYYSSYRSTFSNISANTSWSKYRMDDYEWMDSDESSAGAEKERLHDFYDYKMNEFLTDLKRAKQNYQSDWMTNIQKVIEEQLTNLKAKIHTAIDKYDLEFNFYLSDSVAIPLKHHFSVRKMPTPSVLYVEQRTEYRERLIFKGRGDIRYALFRLTNVSDFKSTCKEFLERTLQNATEETVTDFEVVLSGEGHFEIEREIAHLKEQISIKLEKLSEEKQQLDEKLTLLNERKQQYLNVLKPISVEELNNVQEAEMKQSSKKKKKKKKKKNRKYQMMKMTMIQF